MSKKEKDEIIEASNIDGSEDVTKYGEFVSSYFAWLTLEKQKKQCEKMENITPYKSNMVNKIKKF